MPISSDVGAGIFKGIFGGFFGTSLRSPFWMALIITVIIILIILFVYPAKKSASLSKLFKLMIYIFVTSLILIFLHDSAMLEAWKIEHEDEKQRQAIGVMSDFINNGSRPIIPTAGGEKIPIIEPRIGGSSLIEPKSTVGSLITPI